MTKLSDEAMRKYDKVAEQLWKRLFPNSTMTYQEALRRGLLDRDIVSQCCSETNGESEDKGTMTRVRGHEYSPEEWLKYPIRVCRWSHECRICKGSIVGGNEYYDGGYSRRAHADCVVKLQHKDAILLRDEGAIKEIIETCQSCKKRNTERCDSPYPPADDDWCGAYKR